MARKTRKHSIMMLPSRQLAGRVGRLFVVTSLALVLLLGKGGNSTIAAVEGRLRDALVPVLNVVSAPLDAIHAVSEGMGNWASTYRQNQLLQQENRELLKWQVLAKEMQTENAKLRALLHVAPERNTHFVTARIVSDYGSAFSSAASVNAGKEEGVMVDQAVISERGLVGRVMSVGAHSAKVLLLTDMNSRIPVMNERTREKMILTGKGSADLPTLSYVATDSDTRKGDRIITSGDGGIFPKNMVVGTVRDANKAAMQVELFAAMADVEYVSVVQYDSP